MRFLGLNSVILLSKMGERALDSLMLKLIWELPIGIYEGFMKSFHSPKLAQKSYSHFKKQKIKYIKKRPVVRLEPMTLGFTV